MNNIHQNKVLLQQCCTQGYTCLMVLYRTGQDTSFCNIAVDWVLKGSSGRQLSQGITVPKQSLEIDWMSLCLVFQYLVFRVRGEEKRAGG